MGTGGNEAKDRPQHNQRAGPMNKFYNIRKKRKINRILESESNLPFRYRFC